MSLILFAIKLVVVVVVGLTLLSGCGEEAEEGDALDRAGADVRLLIGAAQPPSLASAEDAAELAGTLTELRYYRRVDCGVELASPDWTCLSLAQRCRGGNYPTVCFETRTAGLRTCLRSDSTDRETVCYGRTFDGAGAGGGPAVEYYCDPAAPAWQLGADQAVECS